MNLLLKYLIVILVSITFLIVANNSESFDTLVLYNDQSETPDDLVAALEDVPDIDLVEIFDGHVTTPDLTTLASYDLVYIHSYNHPWADDEVLGDNLADFIDSGGAIVADLCTIALGCLPVKGRFLTENYLPMSGDILYDKGIILGKNDSAHPIMKGVNSVKQNFYTFASLVSGADLIASWENKEYLVALKGSVVSLAMLLANDYWNGYDNSLLVTNSAVCVWAQSKNPVYESIAPISSLPVDDVTLLVKGNFFHYKHMEVTLAGPGLDAEGCNISVTDYQTMVIDFDLSAAEPGSYDIIITNSHGTITVEDVFTVSSAEDDDEVDDDSTSDDDDEDDKNKDSDDDDDKDDCCCG